MHKQTIRLDISYDGTNYKGLQKQKTEKTVQGELEKVLTEIYGEEVFTALSGRTDTGVHALHQVISFKTAKKIPASGLQRVLNSLLPVDIRVNKVIVADDKFHARFSPKSRTYMFIIYNNQICPPFFANYAWHVREKISLFKLRRCLACFKGEHDFTSFSEQTDKENHVRKILKIKVKKKKDFITIYITGTAFLRRMIRCIVGSSVTLTLKKDLKPKLLKEILLLKKRSLNPFPTAPPRGLYLYKIDF